MEGFEYAQLFDSLFIPDFASLSLLPPSPFLLSSFMSELWSLVLDSSHLASSLSSVCQSVSTLVRSDPAVSWRCCGSFQLSCCFLYLLLSFHLPIDCPYPGQHQLDIDIPLVRTMPPAF